MQKLRLFSSRSAAKQVLEVMFDGSCGLCRTEVDLLRRTKVGSDASQTRFINIASGEFCVSTMGHWEGRIKSVDELYAEMHVFDVNSGVMYKRVEAFRQLYLHLGAPRWLVQWTSKPPFDSMTDSGYTIFLRYIRPVLSRCL